MTCPRLKHDVLYWNVDPNYGISFRVEIVKLFMTRKDADWVIDNSPAGPSSPIEQIYGDNHHSFLTFGI